MDRLPWKSQPKFPEAKSDTCSEDEDEESSENDDVEEDNGGSNDSDDQTDREKRNKSFMISRVRNSTSSDVDDNEVFAQDNCNRISECQPQNNTNGKELHQRNSQNSGKTDQKQQNSQGKPSQNSHKTQAKDIYEHPKKSFPRTDQKNDEQKSSSKRHRELSSNKQQKEDTKQTEKGKHSKTLDKKLNLPKLLTLNDVNNLDDVQEQRQEKNRNLRDTKSQMLEKQLKSQWTPNKPLPSEPSKVQKKIHRPSDNCRIIKWKPCACVDNGIRKLMWHFGDQMTKYFLIFLLISLLLCGLFGLGALLKRHNLSIKAPFDHFKPPAKSRSSDALDIDSIFNTSNRRYDSIRRQSGSDFSFIFKATSEDGNVLREDVIEDYLSLKQMIEEIKVVDHSNKLHKYSTLCRHWQEPSCGGLNVVEAAMNGVKSVKFRYPDMEVAVATGSNGTQQMQSATTVFSADTFGGVETDLDGSIARAQTLAAHFKLMETKNVESSTTIGEQSDYILKNLLKQWSSEFEKIVDKERDKSKLYKLLWWSKRTFDSAVGETFRLLYLYSSATAAILIACSILICAKIIGCRRLTVWSSIGPIMVVLTIFTILGAASASIGINGYLNSAILPTFFIISACSIFLCTSAVQTWRKYNAVVVNPSEKFKFVLCWEKASTIQICIIISLSYAICSKVFEIPLLKACCYSLASAMLLMLILTVVVLVGLLYQCEKRELSDSMKLLDLDEKVLDKLSMQPRPKIPDSRRD